MGGTKVDIYTFDKKINLGLRMRNDRHYLALNDLDTDIKFVGVISRKWDDIFELSVLCCSEVNIIKVDGSIIN